MTEREIYLDNNATTRPAPEVVEALLPYLAERFGNPSSQHRAGVAAREAVIRARAAVAAAIGARPSEVVLTSGCTEGNHQAILGALALVPTKRHIITSGVEHPSTRALLSDLEREGVEVTYLPVDGRGQLAPEQLARAITERTGLVSLMWANNETGVLFPIAELAEIARSRGVLFHCDAAQVVGRIAIDLRKTTIDLLSLSGHKLHGPKGVGALFVRSGLPLAALLRGQQERRRRGGTENVPGIVGLGAAARLMVENDLERASAQMAFLRDRLEAGVVASVPGVRVNGAGAGRLPNTSNLCFSRLDGEALLARLERAGVLASSGAACSSGTNEPSHVLTAIGLTPAQAMSSIRFSLSRYTVAAEVDAAIAAIAAGARTLLACEEHDPTLVPGLVLQQAAETP